MKKIMIVFFVCVLMLQLFVFTASAEDSDASKLYQQQYDISGVEELEKLLPEDTNELLDSFGIDPENPEAIEQIKTENILSSLWEMLTKGLSQPLSVVMQIIGVLLIFAAADGLITEPAGNGISVFACFLAALLLLQPVYVLIDGLESALKGISTFMLSFVPVYAGIMVSSGNAGTAGGFSALLLAAAEGISQFMSFAFLPLISGCMCLCISGGISPVPGISRLAEWIKKSAIWVMGIITTVFLGVLSIQTTVTASADNLGIRTSKAVISGSIPIMGPAIAETLNTARGCLTLLRSGVGIYGAVAVALIALPILTELIVWRLGIWLCTGVSELFCMQQVGSLFKAVDFCLSILVGVVSFTALLFIISMTVSLKTGG